jgi:uncharacterized repeat protein (TIGR01451 family)
MKRYVASAAGLLVLLPLLAGAQQAGSIAVTSTAEVEAVQKTAGGKIEVKRVDASNAKVTPGDVVVFTNRYRNKGTTPAANVVVINPVPEHMIYVDLSAEGKGTKIEFSTDGGKTFAAPGKLTVTDKEGRVRPALPKDYTHIRWTVIAPLSPGASGVVSFRARVQ